MKASKHAHAEADQLKDNAMDAKDDVLEKVQAGTEKVNELVEKTASVTPSLLFAGAALLSIAASLILQLRGRRHWSLFVGHWAPTFLLFGLYNKASKTVGAA